MVKKQIHIILSTQQACSHYTYLFWGHRGRKNWQALPFKFLGHWVDDLLDWTYHTDTIIHKIRSANYALARVKNKFPLSARKAIYTCLVQSHLIWGSSVTGATTMSNTNKLEAAQNKAIRNMAGAKYNCHTLPIYSENTLLKASDLAYTAQVLTVSNSGGTRSLSLSINCSNIPMSLGTGSRETVHSTSMFK